MSKDEAVNWISRDLLKQFTSTWNMLGETIYNVTDENWYLTENEWTFAGIVCHILETQEFYFGSEPEEMVWGKYYGDKSKIEDAPGEYFPSKDNMIKLQAELEQLITKKLRGLSNEDLKKKDGFKWFNSIYEKLTYLLRHNAHHLGELGRMLRAWELEHMKWQ